MNADFLVPVAFFATVFGVYFLRSRENISMIDRGINPRKSYGGPNPFGYMKYGLLLMGLGTGLFLSYLIELMIPSKGFSIGPRNPALYFSLMAIGGGLGLFISYKLEKKHWERAKERTEEE